MTPERPTTTSAFAHRALTGWISEFANRPLPGVWPQIQLDDNILTDLDAYCALSQECGYNEIVLWGLFVDRRWPLDIAATVDDDRRERIARILEMAHARGLKVLGGIGLYSWGFDAWIEANPRLSRTNPRALCPNVPDSHAVMERVLDFVAGEFGLDGFNMQSADNGRCECADCQPLSTVAYHARLNARVARYLCAHWPEKLRVVDNWGCPFDTPNALTELGALSREVDMIIDYNNSAERAGAEFRRELIANLACPFGTLAGRSVWPPQRWPRDRWFLPTTLTNVDYLRRLYKDGGQVAEQFVTTLANPSGEITLRFTGKLLADMEADPRALLEDAVDCVYEPRDRATRDQIVDILIAAEHAYFSQTNELLTEWPDLFYVDGGLMHEAEPNPAAYLRALSLEKRAAYGQAIERLAQEFERARPGIGRAEKADHTARCFRAILADLRELD